MPPDVVAIFGPTGVGKSEVAVELADVAARRADPVGVSADAIAVYEGLDVLAAKPPTDRLEYRMVSCVPIDEEFSAGRYAELAHPEIDGLVEQGRVPIVVGGTGLYLRAALTELDLRPPPEPDLRARLEQELAEVGPASLHGRLSTATAQAVHPNDRKRIVRALELELMGSAPHPRSDELWSQQLRRPTALFGLTMERDALIERIRGARRRDARRRCDRGGGAGARARRFAHGAQGARLQGDRGSPPGRASLEETESASSAATSPT